jgi:hypothetical protein
VAPEWVDELDLHAGPPAASMATRVLDDRRWLLVDDDWVAQRDEARLLLQERRGDVLAPARPVVASVLAARVDEWLGRHHPDLAVDGVDDTDPLAAARQRVAEDLCVLERGTEGWVLTAGCVCFPSYWRLHEKVGRPLSEVHEPVPGYAGALATRVDTFLDRLRLGNGVWRRNWSIHDRPTLYVPEHPATPAPGGRWLRSEYQTLVRLTGDTVAFTIRTQQVPVEALADRPDRCADLAAALRGWSPAQRAYKGGAVDDALLSWLDAQAGA